jgi:hypothetical protein
MRRSLFSCQPDSKRSAESASIRSRRFTNQPASSHNLPRRVTWRARLPCPSRSKRGRGLRRDPMLCAERRASASAAASASAPRAHRVAARVYRLAEPCPVSQAVCQRPKEVSREDAGAGECPALPPSDANSRFQAFVLLGESCLISVDQLLIGSPLGAFPAAGSNPSRPREHAANPFRPIRTFCGRRTNVLASA